MSAYSSYKHLIGRPYISGRRDCYGLLRDYFRDLHGITLCNFARPESWWHHEDMNLIGDFLFTDQWKDIGTNLRNLKIGDALVFSLLHEKANHIGVYVGNGNFIHHVFNRFSAEEALLPKWTSRLLCCVRNLDLEQKISRSRGTLDFQEIMSAHALRNITQQVRTLGA